MQVERSGFRVESWRCKFRVQGLGLRVADASSGFRV